MVSCVREATDIARQAGVILAFEPEVNNVVDSAKKARRLMDEIGYDGYLCYELCHPALSEAHEPLGLEYVHEQVKLAQEYMSALMESNA